MQEFNSPLRCHHQNQEEIEEVLAEEIVLLMGDSMDHGRKIAKRLVETLKTHDWVITKR